MYISLVQVQRKQLQKTVQGTESKSTKPSASPSPPKEATKQEIRGKEEQAVEEKLEKLSLDDTQETEPTPEPSSKSTAVIENLTVMRDQERIQCDSARDASSSEDTEHPAMTTSEEVEQEAGGGGEGEEEEELKAKVEEAEEQLLKRLERMQAESQVTQETIKKMTGYLKALDVAPDVISPTDEGTTPQSESRGADDEDGASGGNASAMVGDMDPVAQAALLGSIKERTTTATTSASATPEEDAGEIMEPVQVSETDPNNVVIAGEIVGGAQIAPTKSTVEEDAHPAASEGAAVDPKIESVEAGDLIGQTAQNLEPVLGEKVDDTPAVPTTKARETIEAPSPSFHSPSKKPKRQLAASFTNITKE